MTTIATDGFSIAADGLEVRSDMIVGTSCQKLRRLKSGRIVGFAGFLADGIAFCEWLEGGPRPKSKQLSALVVEPDGQVFSYDVGLIPMPAETPTAIGSGAGLALAAMKAGATPEEAVEIAAELDIFTGGRVVSFDLPSRE